MSEQDARAVIHRPVVSIGEGLVIGPGKIDLLRSLREHHSISAAAREVGMTYKRAWALIDTLNRGFGRPVVEASAGGKGGGGAHLTPLGEQLIGFYLALEQKLNAASVPELEALARLVK